MGSDLEFGNGSHRNKRKEARLWSIDFFCPIEFDPSQVILEKLEINEKKYPVDRAKGSAKKLNETPRQNGSRGALSRHGTWEKKEK